ncbi:filamin-B-like [Brevipalpus obovatus]|uniref:filamin-B-like n=1 Tax=Brevipalpus obovatus TaxID=246614 RepID=UPI003D9DDF33
MIHETGEELKASDITASGAGLHGGNTGDMLRFSVYTHYIPDKNSNFDPRALLDIALEGNSTPIPLNVESGPGNTGEVNCAFSPVLPGVYTLNIRFKGDHIIGSPFKIKVEGESIRQFTMTAKVKVYGPNVKDAVVGGNNIVCIDINDKSIAGGLSAVMAGPRGAKVDLKMTQVKETVYDVSYSPSVAGVYVLYVKIAEVNVPGSPFTIKAK